MKTAILPQALFAASLSLLALPVLANSGATGTVTIAGTSWPVADAVATLDGEDLQVVFSEKAFDRAAWAEDGEFGTFDLWEFKDNEARDAQSLTIDIDEEDGSYGGHNVRTGSSSGGGFSSDYDESVTLTARDDTHVAGTITLAGDDLAADIRFDLPITQFGPLARAGKPLPADGGEPGKALKTMVDATHAGNLDQMIALSHPERRKGIEEAKASGEAEQMLKMAQAFTPKISKITGGVVDGDNAWVDFEGQEDGNAVKGTAELSRADGKWYIKGINTKSGG